MRVLMSGAVVLSLGACGGGTQEKVYDEAEAPGGARVKRGVKPEPDA